MHGYDYAKHLDHPELIQLCRECNSEECDGICNAWRKKWRELFSGEITQSRERMRYNVPMDAFGETHTLLAWSRLYGIQYETLLKRIMNGYSLEESLKCGARMVPIAQYEYHGVKMSIREWSEVTGIGEETLRYRIKRGWPMEKVFGKKPWVKSNGM